MTCKNFIRISRIFFAPLCLCVITGITSCTKTESSRAEFVLGTVCSVTLFDQGKNNVYHDIFARIREIENLMNVNISSSDVSRINANAGIAPVQVHEDVFRVIERAVFFANLSRGAFDPTIGPLVSLWGINSDNPRVPSKEEIEDILPLINWRNIEMDAQAHSVFLKRRGMALDLGAIAKGYAADEAAAIVKKAGIKRAIIDLGGNIFITGEKKGTDPWRVGIQNPNEKRGIHLGVLRVSESTGKQTVVTSGVYERFFEKDGKRYHHIFSPSQGSADGYPGSFAGGYPVNNGLLSVTIISSVSMDADALSTAVFILGYDEGSHLIESLPGTEAVFIFEDKSVRVTQGADFTLADKTFRIE